MMKVNEVGSWACLQLAGDFDLINSNQIVSVTADLIEQGTTDLSMDLTHVRFMGAEGIDALRQAANTVEAAEGRMLIVGASPLLHETFSATGDDSVLPRADPVAAIEPALSYIGGRRGRGSPRQLDHVGIGNDELASPELQVERVTVTDLLQAVARDAVHTVPGCSAATICLLTHGTPRTAVVSDAVAVKADVAQYTLGEGPCLLAARTAQRVQVERLSDDARFTHFARLADQVGIRSALSSPVIVESNLVGTVNLYSSSRFAETASADAKAVILRAAAATSSSSLRTEPYHV